jgi:hypothetical protein
MIKVEFTGNSAQDIAREAKQFVDSILGAVQSSGSVSGAQQESDNQSEISADDGYRPAGVGSPRYCPVDDGREWDQNAVDDLVSRLTEDGRKVLEILAKGLIIDPRKEASNLGWAGTHWAGVWTGPRRQANEVAVLRDLKSWPYGHTYDEPRRLWIHPEIAKRVINALEHVNSKLVKI